MPKSFQIAKAHWLGTRFNIVDAAGKVRYQARLGGRRVIFFSPGVDEPLFETRPKSVFSGTRALVESAVDYELAYFRGHGVSGSMAIVMNVAEEPVGFVIHAEPWDRFLEWRKENDYLMESQEPVDLLKRALSIKPGFKTSFMESVKSARSYHLVSSAGKTAATFEVPKDKKSVNVTILDESGRYFDERLILALALRCLMAQNQNNGG